jgi:bifunctional DNA-binding transcriptional regulator/antitoxin component of YhaV-PrlF toxin-antitoxin module
METSKRPKVRPKNFGRKAAIESAIDKILKEDRQRGMDRAGMLEALEFGEMGMMTPSELKRLRKQLGLKRGGEVQKMEDGGAAVPKKYKGFSKLPENVQEKIDPDLAQKYEKGGEVKKKKGNSKKTGVCRGAGAAVRGTRFSGVR